ncbi:MAG TPA: hypothetical protein VFD26_11250 [Methyloceanibacter sp.]|nr:hypothetical protein [Methyloceanibacter sp.]
MTGADGGPEPADEADYNPIFEKLVDQDGSETRGIIAYGFYKVAKREWAEKVHEEEGRAPTPDALRAYIATWTPSRLEGVRKEADQLLAAYAENVIAEAEPRILKNALRGGFWRGVGASMVAAVLYTLILIAFATILAWSGVDLIGILKNTAPAS